MIDESKINPQLDVLYNYFQNILSKYFDEGNLIPEYFEEVCCYNCGNNEYSNVFVVNRFRHIRCSNCGMVYAMPRLKESIAHNLYSKDNYTEFYKIKLCPSIDYRRNVLGINKYNQLMSFFESPGKVLDIGCGLGEVLSVSKEHGWDCLGIEFNKFAADYGKDKFGLSIINKNVYDFEDTEKYDLIMMWGILEHFYDPLKILNKVNELLLDNGVLLIEVPSADSLLVRYYERTSKIVDRIIEGDRHIMLFSFKSFTELLDKAGFKAVNIVSNGLDVSTLNRLELDKIMTNEMVNKVQQLLDDSLQGDLLRGFFKKRSKI